MNALDLITQERNEQILKHGFDEKQDDLNINSELKYAAAYLLTNNVKYFPQTWMAHYKEKFDKKESEIEKLKVAGALIAAEIDRLKRLK